MSGGDDDDETKAASSEPPLLLDPISLQHVPAALNHDTLKYHLLGPSLLKAGQDTVDQQKVSEVIYNASKGSKFFNNEESKDKVLTDKINNILARKRQLEKLDLTSDLRRADDYIAELELSRDLSQYVVHIDCDAFYAAVEELDRPELKHVPMAVGKGVLTTCNYHARKFGCRSGMAGFVAMKLCPDLICLPLNFDKYTAKAEEVRAVLAEYDPRFESASIDEAYLNITNYCAEHQRDPEEVVSQMRAQVFEQAKVTISAGIAANAKLAKISSNQNKPNGQFRLANDRALIMAFMRNLPTRKVNGIGRVFERELDAIGIKTCGDIYAQRAYLPKLFGDKAYRFLINCHLGLGKTDIRPAEEYERKSVGTESTFRDTSGRDALHAKLRHAAEELEKDLQRTQYKGRTLVLKIKLHTYEVLTRQTAPPKAVQTADDLYRYSLPMLDKLEKEIPGMTLRLLGLRVTHIVSTKKAGVDFFGLGKLKDGGTACTGSGDGEWQVWPEAEFEEAARQEREDELEAVEALSQEHADALERHGHEPHDETKTPQPQPSPARRHGREIRPNPKPATQRDTSAPPPDAADDVWACPICGRPQAADDRSFNEHIDLCLSRQTIERAVKDTSEAASSSTGTGTAANAAVGGGKGASRKRGRPVSRGPGEASSGGNAQKKLFFSAA